MLKWIGVRKINTVIINEYPIYTIRLDGFQASKVDDNTCIVCNE